MNELKIIELDKKKNNFKNIHNIKENKKINIKKNYNKDLYKINNQNFISKSGIIYHENEQKDYEKEKEPTDNIIRKNKNKKDINKFVNRINNLNLNSTDSEEIDIKDLSSIKADKKRNKKNNKNKISSIPLCKNINFDQPTELILTNESNKNSLQCSKSFCDIDKAEKIKDKLQFNERNNISERQTGKIQKLNKYLFRQNSNDSIFHKKGNEIRKNLGNIKIENKISQIDDNKSDISCSILKIFYSKRENNNRPDKKLNLNNINNSTKHKINNQLSSDDKKTKNNKNYKKKEILLIPNSKLKIYQYSTKEGNKDKIMFTPDSISYNNIENSKTSKYNNSKVNINTNKKFTKYLKINKTFVNKKDSIKNRIDNYNNKNFHNLKKLFVNSNIHENKKILTAVPSLKIINTKDNNININSINIMNNNNKIKNDIINNEKDFKQSNSYIINNTPSEFNETIDEKNSPVNKRFIHNKMKPRKLLEAFKKELAERSRKELVERSKNENILKLK